MWIPHRAGRALPAVVVLDLGLPDLDGIEVLAGIRGWSAIPVIVLSARSTSADKVEALDVGADDYVTKPFGMDELLARIRAAVRRRRRQPPAPPWSVPTDDFTVDLAAHAGAPGRRAGPADPHRVAAAGGAGRHPGRLVPQRQLLTEVWGPGYERRDQLPAGLLAQLRRKLEPDPARPRHLITEPGMVTDSSRNAARRRAESPSLELSSTSHGASCFVFGIGGRHPLDKQCVVLCPLLRLIVLLRPGGNPTRRPLRGPFATV